MSNRDLFEAKIQKTDTCWLWTGYTINGYGQLTRNYKRVLAHRYAYELYVGEIPDGLLVLHKCDVRNCVNPEHLFIGTAQDNTDDMISKGRCRSGLFNKQKTHCIRGHELSGANIGVRPNGSRYCNVCRRLLYKETI